MTSHLGVGREVENRFLWENRAVLREEYAGQWIVLKGDCVVAADLDQAAAEMKALTEGIEAPHVVHMAPPNVKHPILVPFTLIDPS